MEFVSSTRQLKTGQGGKILLHIHHSVVAQRQSALIMTMND